MWSLVIIILIICGLEQGEYVYCTTLPIPLVQLAPPAPTSDLFHFCHVPHPFHWSSLCHVPHPFYWSFLCHVPHLFYWIHFCYTPHKLLVRKFLKRTLDLFNRDIEYSYQVQRIPYADYRVNQLIPLISSEEFTNSFDESSQSKTREFRLFRKRYGIKIEFYQSGKLGELAWRQKILSLRLNLLDSWLLETGDSVIIKCSYHTHHYKWKWSSQLWSN